MLCVSNIIKKKVSSWAERNEGKKRMKNYSNYNALHLPSLHQRPCLYRCSILEHSLILPVRQGEVPRREEWYNVYQGWFEIFFLILAILKLSTMIPITHLGYTFSAFLQDLQEHFSQTTFFTCNNSFYFPSCLTSPVVFHPEFVERHYSFHPGYSGTQE